MSCLESAKKVSTICTTNACPLCRDIEFKTFRNKAIDREIRELHVFCTNKEKGCKWQGELIDINNHLGNSDGCQCEEVKCSNECGKMIERQYLTSHVENECPRRKVNCQYCHDTGEHQFIKGQHKEECPKVPPPSPNNCNADLTIIKHELKDTKSTLAKVKVKLADTEQKLANTENKLTDTNNQLASALQHISTLEVLLYLTTDKVVAKPISRAVILESSLRWSDKLVAMTMMSKSGDQECPVILKMSQFNKQKTFEWYSDSFYTHNKGYKMSLRVDAAGVLDGKDTHLSVFLYLMKGSHDDQLIWPLREKFELMLNQLSNGEHYSDTLTYDVNAPIKSRSKVTQSDRSRAADG